MVLCLSKLYAHTVEQLLYVLFILLVRAIFSLEFMTESVNETKTSLGLNVGEEGHLSNL